jgi:hypothetical protein
VTKKKEVYRINPHAAVLVYKAKFKMYARDGQLLESAHRRLMSCWVQRDGGWFVKFSQASNFPESVLIQPYNFTSPTDYTMPGYLFNGTNLNLLRIPILNRIYLDPTRPVIYDQLNILSRSHGRNVVTARQEEKGSVEVRDFAWRETA